MRQICVRYGDSCQIFVVINAKKSWGSCAHLIGCRIPTKCLGVASNVPTWCCKRSSRGTVPVYVGLGESGVLWGAVFTYGNKVGEVAWFFSHDTLMMMMMMIITRGDVFTFLSLRCLKAHTLYHKPKRKQSIEQVTVFTQRCVIITQQS